MTIYLLTLYIDNLAKNPSHLSGNTVTSHMLFLTFLQIQLERVLGKPQIHSPGPKKPTLAQIDLNLKPKR